MRLARKIRLTMLLGFGLLGVLLVGLAPTGFVVGDAPNAADPVVTSLGLAVVTLCGLLVAGEFSLQRRPKEPHAYDVA